MASQNVLQLQQQTGSADPTSVLYAVKGGNTDTGLPLSVLFTSANLITPTTTNGTFTHPQIVSPTIAGGSADNISIGGLTPGPGSFTTLSATTPVAIVSGGTGATTASAARTNLGLGTAATANTGTSGSVVPLLNAANTWSLAQTFSVRPTFNGATPWDSANLNFATPPAIGGTTPAAGAFTTLSATGLITPSSTVGIKGTATNDSAQAGSVGEYMTAAGSAIALTSLTPANITSVTLTAGDWEVMGSFTASPAGTSTVSAVAAGFSLTSATLPIAPDIWVLQATLTTGAQQSGPVPSIRVSVTTSTQVFLVGQVGFGVSTCTGAGRIRARRVR